MLGSYKQWFRAALVLGALALVVALAGLGGGATSTEAGADRQQVLVKFKPGAPADRVRALNARLGARVSKRIPQIGVTVLTVPAGSQRTSAAKIRASGLAIFAELDSTARVTAAVDDPNLSQQWALAKVGAAQAWDVSQSSPSILIGIVDTGIDASHPDLSAKVVASANFSTSSTSNDVNGHGTSTAGLAAASTNNAIGVAGVGYQARVLNAKGMNDDGTGDYSAIAQAIIWATDRGASVINLSLGGYASSSTLESAVNYAYDRGVVLVAAAGNQSLTDPFYPAALSNVIGVAATDRYDALAIFSNHGPWVDVAAPGVGTLTTVLGGSYANTSGTSMASPIVAGLAALVLPRMTDANGNGRLNDETWDCIRSGADNIGIADVGAGRINAARATSCTPTATTPTTGDVSGVVSDALTGALLPGATVTDGTRATTSDAQGRYTISGVPAGGTSITASANGHQPTTRSVAVTAGTTTTQAFPLPPVTATPTPAWVKSIAFTQKRTLRIDVTAATVAGPLPGVSVSLSVATPKGLLTFAGVTGSTGVVSFTIQKPAPGLYTATVTALALSGYSWDVLSGLTSASYTAR